MVMKKSDSSPSVLYRLPEATQLLGVGMTTLRKLIRGGKLPVVRIGPRGLRIPSSSIETFIAENQEKW